MNELNNDSTHVIIVRSLNFVASTPIISEDDVGEEKIKDA